MTVKPRPLPDTSSRQGDLWSSGITAFTSTPDYCRPTASIATPGAAATGLGLLRRKS